MTHVPVTPEGMNFGKGLPSAIATKTPAGGSLLHISGQVPRDGDGAPVAKGDIAGQAEQVFHNIRQIVEDQGGIMQDVFKLTIYVTEREHLAAIGPARRANFSEPYPAVTALVISALANPDWLIEIEATAHLAE